MKKLLFIFSLFLSVVGYSQVYTVKSVNGVLAGSNGNISLSLPSTTTFRNGLILNSTTVSLGGALVDDSTDLIFTNFTQKFRIKGDSLGITGLTTYAYDIGFNFEHESIGEYGNHSKITITPFRSVLSSQFRDTATNALIKEAKVYAESDTLLSRITVEADELQIINGSQGEDKVLTSDGSGVGTWQYTALQSRVSTQFDKTTDAALANITGLTATLVAGKTYKFEAVLYTTSNIAGGVKVGLGGTATNTALVYSIRIVNSGTITQGRTTSTGVTAVTAADIFINGTITVDTGGTFTIQFAQNVSNGTASSVLVGSTLTLTKIL